MDNNKKISNKPKVINKSNRQKNNIFKMEVIILILLIVSILFSVKVIFFPSEQKKGDIQIITQSQTRIESEAKNFLKDFYQVTKSTTKQITEKWGLQTPIIATNEKPMYEITNIEIIEFTGSDLKQTQIKHKLLIQADFKRNGSNDDFTTQKFLLTLTEPKPPLFGKIQAPTFPALIGNTTDKAYPASLKYGSQLSNKNGAIYKSVSEFLISFYMKQDYSTRTHPSFKAPYTPPDKIQGIEILKILTVEQKDGEADEIQEGTTEKVLAEIKITTKEPENVFLTQINLKIINRDQRWEILNFSTPEI